MKKPKKLLKTPPLKKHSLYLFAAIIIIICIFASLLYSKYISSVSRTSQQLCLTVVEADDTSIIQLNKNNDNPSDGSVTCYGLTDVAIEVNSRSMLLETALQTDYITTDALTAFARIDAKNNICVETYTSLNGLATFTYRYPDYDLKVIYDVYETPDGKQHLIHEIKIVKPGIVVYSSGGNLLDQEDWGVEFEVLQASPTGISIKCDQAAGQQLGNLVLDHYTLDRETEEGFVPVESQSADINPTEVCSPQFYINMADTTIIDLDWSDVIGPLSPGSYSIKLTLADDYDSNLITPMVRNFHDSQAYWIIFEIQDR